MKIFYYLDFIYKTQYNLYVFNEQSILKSGFIQSNWITVSYALIVPRRWDGILHKFNQIFELLVNRDFSDQIFLMVFCV